MNRPSPAHALDGGSPPLFSFARRWPAASDAHRSAAFNFSVMTRWKTKHRNKFMKIQRFAIGLTALNLFILMSVLFRANSATTPGLPPVLRVRGLELVDDQGRVRAMLKVFPADPKVKMPDGTTGYPETVLLRLIN